MADVQMANDTTASWEKNITLVGMGYISAGVIFIPLQLLCAYLIHIDQQMRDPTYRFITVLSVADALELCGIALYSGCVLVTGIQYEPIDRCIRFLISITWYTSCLMMVMVAYSRWVVLAGPAVLESMLTNNFIRLIQIAPWMILAVLNIFPFFIKREFYFMPSIFTWAFNMSTTFGRSLYWINFVVVQLCAVVESTFNILSLNWVRKIRKSISPDVATASNQKKEIKLLVQCVIIGSIYVSCCAMFTIAMWISTAEICLLTQVIWMTNHCVNPIIYIAMNKRLRKRVAKVIRCQKL